MASIVKFPHARNVERPTGETISIDPITSRKCVSMFEAFFGDANVGMEYAIAVFYELFFDALKSMKKVFTEAELRVMLLASKSTMLMPEFTGTMMQASVSEFCRKQKNIPGLNERELTVKLLKCSRYQRAVLEIWAHGFWRGKRTSHNEAATMRHMSIML